MTGYAAAQIPTEQQLLFEAATRIVATFPDRQPDGEWVRCHEVARALHRVLRSGEVVDGTYGCAVEHSWLAFEGGILDPYAVGRLPVVQYVDTNHHFKHALLLDVTKGGVSDPLVHQWFGKPLWGGLYRPDVPREDIREDVVAWLLTFSLEEAMFTPSRSLRLEAEVRELV